jgi:hypothetical protein
MMMEDKVRELLRGVADEAPAQREIPPGLQGRARRRMGLALSAKFLTVAVLVVGATFVMRSLIAAPGRVDVGTQPPPLTTESPDPSSSPTSSPTPTPTLTPSTSPEPAAPTTAPCEVPAMMPVIRDYMRANSASGLHVDSFELTACQRGYAHGAVHYTVQEPEEIGGGSFQDAAEVFLQDVDGGWTVITGGTGVVCYPPYEELVKDACEALGLG